MKQIVKMLTVCCAVLCTSLVLVGCSENKPCVPVVKLVKAERVHIDRAEVEQCRYATTLDNVKCVMKNYVNTKAERDQLRSAYEEVTE